MTLPQGAELGTTDDPKALIVGDKAAVAEQATAILDEQRRIGKLLDSLNGLAIDSWQGGIGQLQYGSLKIAEAMKLGAYQEVLKQAGTRLVDYSDALATAQGRAQDAINKWNEGEQTTKEALADHNAAVQSHNERVDAHNARMKAGLPVPAIAFAPPGPFVDPGEALRKEAEEILEDARKELDSAGTTAVNPTSPFAGVSTSGEGKTKGGFPGFGMFDDLKSAFQKGRDLSNGGGDFPGEFMNWKADVSGKSQANLPFGSPDEWSIKAGSAGFEGAVYDLQGKFDQEIGELQFHADGTVTVLGASGEAFARIDKDGLALGAEGHIRLVEAKGGASVKYDEVEIYGKGSAYIGADGIARIDADKEGVHADLGGFAGAKSALEGGFRAGGIGIGLTGEGWAGAGAEAELDAGFNEDGKFVFNAKTGVAAEYGGALGANISVDPDEVKNSAIETIKDPRKLADYQVSPDEIADGGQWLYSHRQEIGDGAKALGGAAWDNREEIARHVVDSKIHTPSEIAESGAMLAGVAYEHREAIGDATTLDADELKSAGSKIARGVKGLFE